MYIEDNNEFKPFENKIWLSSPTMHGPELDFMKRAYEKYMCRN